MVPPRSDRISRVPPYSRTLQLSTCTGLSPAMAQLSRWFQLSLHEHWPGPRSLATTSGVSVDVLSSGYLDVSVPCVRLLSLCIQDKIPSHDNQRSEAGSRSKPCGPVKVRPRNSGHRRWVSPFGNPRIKACSQLPVAYRSVPRPSSPLAAKASTECP